MDSCKFKKTGNCDLLLLDSSWETGNRSRFNQENWIRKRLRPQKWFQLDRNNSVLTDTKTELKFFSLSKTNTGPELIFFLHPRIKTHSNLFLLIHLLSENCRNLADFVKRFLKTYPDILVHRSLNFRSNRDWSGSEKFVSQCKTSSVPTIEASVI